MRHIKSYRVFENEDWSPRIYVLSETPYRYNYDTIDEEEYDNLFDAINHSIELDKKQENVLMRSFYYVDDASKFRYSMDERDIEIIELENDYRSEESYRITKDRLDTMYDGFDQYDPDDEITFVSLPTSIMRTYIGPPEKGDPPKTHGAELIFYYKPGGEGLEEGIMESPLSREEKEVLLRKVRSINVRKNMF